MTDERPSPARARAWGRSFASGLVLTIALVGLFGAESEAARAAAQTLY